MLPTERLSIVVNRPRAAGWPRLDEGDGLRAKRQPVETPRERPGFAVTGAGDSKTVLQVGHTIGFFRRS
jgi:hypothetical protein